MSDVGKNMVDLPCLNCGKIFKFEEHSFEAEGIFNVFCSDKDCEDEHEERGLLQYFR